jgi:dephospho-CoA kinase
MIVLGLTGSIAMGKSTTAQMFREAGVPVHDSDAAVHRLYRGEAAPMIEKLFPGTTSSGVVDRAELARRVLDDADAMARLEAAIHPLVRQTERDFLQQARNDGVDLAILDIPLLYETDAQDRLDGVIVVTAPPAEQRRRALARPNMSEEKLAAILARQTPDAEKRRRADFVIDTAEGMAAARRQVDEIVACIRTGRWKPERLA